MFVIYCSSCTVTVVPPWQKNTYIPLGSSVYINCTATRQDQSPVWSIKLANWTNSVGFSDQTETVLNNLGFYEVIVPDSGTIQLLFNESGSGINQATIKCINIKRREVPTLYETTLVVYGKCSSQHLLLLYNLTSS